MADAALANSTIADIETVTQPTHDEIARQRFCSVLRRHAIQDFATALEADYRGRIAPRLPAPHQKWREIDKAMQGENSYRFYSSLRYNAQEMCFLSVQPEVERALPELIAISRDAAERNPAGGSLRLADDFEVPT
jgi:hypothetical protein